MPLPEAPFIFVSYARTDSDFVLPEIERLEGQGHKIWYDKDKLDPGLFWDKAISEAIEACACFIVFVTEDSINSINVLKEIVPALSAKKRFISIHWEKVELPDDFPQRMRSRGVEIPDDFWEQLRSRQALDRYALLKHEYEEPLRRALAPYKESGFRPPAPTPNTRLDDLPKIVFFTLVLLAVILLLFAVILVVIPHFASAMPGDPLNNRLGGLLSGLLFTAIACGLGVGAFVIHRLYLRGKNG